MSGEDIVPRPRDDEQLLVISEDDLLDILSDCAVDYREVVDEEAVPKLVDITLSRFDDDFYYE